MQANMQIKLLKEIVKDVAGPGTEKLVDILYGKKNVNEFIIANKLGLTINQTRNILYKLGEEAIVSFIRKKDKKKGGWYTYFWTLDVEKGLSRYKEKIHQEKNALNHQLETRKKATFFYCQNCDIEYTEESALANQYTCTECGEVLEVKEPREIITHIEEEMKKKQALISTLDAEIVELQEKGQKVRDRKMKAEQKKKEIERKEAAAKRASARALAKKKTEKEGKPEKKSAPKKVAKKAK